MACNHDFITAANLPSTHCRCKQCLSAFPVSMWCEQLQARMKKIEDLLGLLQRKVDHQQDFYGNIEQTVLDRLGNFERQMKDFAERIDKFMMEEPEPLMPKDLPADTVSTDAILPIKVKKSVKKRKKRKKRKVKNENISNNAG